MTAKPARTRTRANPTWVRVEDSAVGDTLPQLARLAEVVGHQHRLTVPRHHRVHGAEQDGCGHRDEDSAHVSAGDFPKPAGHSVVEPALDRDKAVHYPMSVECDRR